METTQMSTNRGIYLNSSILYSRESKHIKLYTTWLIIVNIMLSERDKTQQSI